MKRLKKVFVLLIMLLLLVACGSENEDVEERESVESEEREKSGSKGEISAIEKYKEKNKEEKGAGTEKTTNPLSGYWAWNPEYENNSTYLDSYRKIERSYFVFEDDGSCRIMCDTPYTDFYWEYYPEDEKLLLKNGMITLYFTPKLDGENLYLHSGNSVIALVHFDTVEEVKDYWEASIPKTNWKEDKVFGDCFIEADVFFSQINEQELTNYVYEQMDMKVGEIYGDYPYAIMLDEPTRLGGIYRSCISDGYDNLITSNIIEYYSFYGWYHLDQWNDNYYAIIVRASCEDVKYNEDGEYNLVFDYSFNRQIFGEEKFYASDLLQETIERCFVDDIGVYFWDLKQGVSTAGDYTNSNDYYNKYDYVIRISSISLDSNRYGLDGGCDFAEIIRKRHNNHVQEVWDEKNAESEEPVGFTTG